MSNTAIADITVTEIIRDYLNFCDYDDKQGHPCNNIPSFHVTGPKHQKRGVFCCLQHLNEAQEDMLKMENMSFWDYVSRP